MAEELATRKKANEVEYISQEEYNRRVKIIAKSKRDIIWWAEHFFRIVNMSTGLEIIKLYAKQKELLKFLIDNDRVITLASRQTGKCVYKDSKITIRNKKTGVIEHISVDQLYNSTKFSK